MAIGSQLAMVGLESEELDEFLTTVGTCSITTSDVHGESKAAFRCNPTAGNTGYGEVGGRETNGLIISLTMTDVHVGFWFKAKSLPVSGKAGIILQLLNGATHMGLLRVSSGGSLTFIASGWGLVVPAGISAISANTWYWIGVRADIAGNEAEFHVGEESWSGGFSWGGVPTDGILVGHSMASAAYNTAVDFVFDSIIVDTSWHPKADIVRLLPNADGTYDGWGLFPASGDAYEKVDEIPDDGDAEGDEPPAGTYVKSPANYAGFTVNVEPASTRSVSNDIRAVMPWAKVRKVNLYELVQLRIRSGGTDHDGVNFAPVTSYVGLQLVYKVDPMDSNVWTTAKVDALEVGIDWPAGVMTTDRVRVTQTMIFVAFVSSPPVGSTVHIKGGAIKGGVIAA